MWNRKSIKPPPYCELKTSLEDSAMGTLRNTRNKLKDATSPILSDHLTILTNEHYVLSKFIYIIKNQLRREKSMALFRQINSCLKRIHDVDMMSLVNNLTSSMDVQPASDSSDRHFYVGSRQMVEYYLVKLMGLAALLGQTGNYCRSTFVHVIRQLNVGHLLPQNVILISATSRIWYITKSLCLKVCDWYQAVYGCLPFLPATQVPWLPDDTRLPSNLPEWLTSNGFMQSDSTIDEEMAKHLSNSSHPEMSSLEDSTRTMKEEEEDIGEVIKRRVSPIIEDADINRDINHTEAMKTNVNKDAPKPSTATCEHSLSDLSSVVTSKEHKGKKSSTSSKEDLEEDINSNSNQNSSEKLDIKSYLESVFRTFKDISAFQGQVKSSVLDINGVSVQLNKVKKKKILSIIQVTLDSIPEDLKKSKRRKLFSEIAVPELCKILGRITSKLEIK